jgi:hypothetical protein
MRTTPHSSLFSTEVSVKRLDSGYWHLRGIGPCNWAQPPRWPCPDDQAPEGSFFGKASGAFKRLVRAENDRLLNKEDQ